MTYPSASFPTTPDYADVPDADWTPETLERARRRVERNRRINASYGPEPWETTKTPRGATRAATADAQQRSDPPRGQQ